MTRLTGSNVGGHLAAANNLARSFGSSGECRAGASTESQAGSPRASSSRAAMGRECLRAGRRGHGPGTCQPVAARDTAVDTKGVTCVRVGTAHLPWAYGNVVDRVQPVGEASSRAKTASHPRQAAGGAPRDGNR
jgi:hypothetical protein